MAEEQYQKALEKHRIKIVPESEKVTAHVYGQTAEEEKRKAKREDPRVSWEREGGIPYSD